MSRTLHSDAQPDTNDGKQHIYKVPAQNVMSDGKSNERICSSWPDGALKSTVCARPFTVPNYRLFGAAELIYRYTAPGG